MKKMIFLMAAAALMSTGCKKYLEVNNNPNQPTVVSPNSVLSAALAGTASNLGQDFQSLPRWMGYWSRSGNYVPDVQTETYSIPNSYTNLEWGNIYVTLNSYNYIERAGQADALPFYIGVGKVMKAFHFSTLVDIYNDVPYSDAFNVAGAVQPKYDDGQAIYNDLIKQIDSAVIYFDNAKSFYASASAVTLKTDDQYDILFGSGGSASATVASARMDKWVQFANTLELKLLIHQSQVSAQQGLIATELAGIAANGRGFIGAGQSAIVNPGYQNSTNKINPFFANFYNVTAATTSIAYYRANTISILFYQANNDPRIGYVYGLNDNGIYAGNYDGDPTAVSNSYTSPVGSGLLKGPTQNELIFSDFESLFLQAEAAQRGWNVPGNPQALYESAITQNFEYLYQNASNIIPSGATPDADAATYYSQPIPNVGWAASTDKLQAIITQKWAAFNGINQVEAWTDYRRLGIPNLPISKAPTHVEPMIPVRYLYPQTELNTNAAHVPQLGTNAQFTAKIFWNQ